MRSPRRPILAPRLAGALAELACLGLSGNEAVGDAGLEALAHVASQWMPDREDVHDDRKCLPSLRELHVRGIGAGDRGLQALANVIEPRSGGLPALRSLFVSNEHLQHAALKTACCGRGLRLDFF